MDSEKDLAKRIKMAISELNTLMAEAAGMGIKVELDYTTIRKIGDPEEYRVYNVHLTKVTRITEY